MRFVSYLLISTSLVSAPVLAQQRADPPATGVGDTSKADAIADTRTKLLSVLALTAGGIGAWAALRHNKRSKTPVSPH
ncbi:MAG: hypothetical protein JWN69_126 [Alphaproteobacteria bacterium]|jgi:hypothetical protein|nr:hypothetical protein [Alphaproteobacteria bacterium]